MKINQQQYNKLIEFGIKPERIRGLSGFAAACYDQNTFDDLIDVFNPATIADGTDCKNWGITADEWRGAIIEALTQAAWDFADENDIELE